MTTTEFERAMEGLSEEEYDKLIQERIGRLNDEQKVIAQAREDQRKYRAKLIAKLVDPDPEVHGPAIDVLRDSDEDECEHGRHYIKHCLACGEIDYLMFPELYDENGFHIEDDE